MDYEQIKKDLKKITDIAEKLPEKYRKESFEVMIKLYQLEKSIEIDKASKDAKDGAN